PIDKYSKDYPRFKEGLYSDFDAKHLYSVIREHKPKTIIEVGVREGKTTSCIINGLVKNLTEDDGIITYYIFEKDVPYLNKIKTYVNEIISINGLT
ncbi:unnamed protein product, partial [marine sediment metagenome]